MRTIILNLIKRHLSCILSLLLILNAQFNGRGQQSHEDTVNWSTSSAELWSATESQPFAAQLETSNTYADKYSAAPKAEN